MGNGYDYKCRKCHHRYQIFTGIGRLYPKTLEKTVSAIKAGAFGAEWKEAYEKTPGAAIYASNEVFICEDCRKWKEEVDVSIYAPDDPKSRSEMLFPTDGFHVVKEYRPVCPKCGGLMRKASKEELMNLPCPKCGTENGMDNFIMWD